MEVTTAGRTERPAGLDASTVAEAFQLTAQAHPERVALRLKGDEFSMTWAEYAEKVQALAAGLANLGLERGGALGIMLTNRPEFHFFDSAALHLGATPFSVYNTYAPEQIAYQVTGCRGPHRRDREGIPGPHQGDRGRRSHHRRGRHTGSTRR